eukprot:3847796-Rhodomonas_salina.3
MAVPGGGGGERDEDVCAAISLRACYAMSGADVASSAVLSAYARAMLYPPTRVLCDAPYSSSVCPDQAGERALRHSKEGGPATRSVIRPGGSAYLSPYAYVGTDLGVDDTRSVVLTRIGAVEIRVWCYQHAGTEAAYGATRSESTERGHPWVELPSPSYRPTQSRGDAWY